MFDMFQLRSGCVRAMSFAVIVDSASTLGSAVMEDTIVRMHQTNSIAVSIHAHFRGNIETDVWCALKESANCTVEAVTFV